MGNKPNDIKQKKRNEENPDKAIIKNGELPTKVFEERDSVLTDLMENKHILTIYHIFVALHIGIAINSIAHDYIVNNQLRFGLDLINKGFKGFYIFIPFWFCAFLFSLLPYYCVKYWNKVRLQLKSNAMLLYLWDRICLLCYITFMFALLAIAATVAIRYELGFASVVCVLCEPTRMIMKIHAFVRSCAPRFLTNSTDKQNKKVFYPKFSHYLYFLFAPTLLYRDNYPRSRGKIRWGYVLRMLTEVAAGAFFYSFIIDKTYLTEFKDYGLKTFTVGEIILKILNNAFYGMLTMLLMCYLMLHAWLNAFAEMLHFSDKLFYKDWWTSVNYGRYYRTWNMVVHDWLYTYIYKDFYEIVIPKRKILAKLMVFFISSVFHDFIISTAVGFFIPVFLVYFFMFGTFVSLVRTPNTLIGNVFLLYSIALGSSMMLATYSMEYFARVNCAKEELSFSYFFTPKMFACYK